MCLTQAFARLDQDLHDIPQRSANKIVFRSVRSLAHQDGVGLEQSQFTSDLGRTPGNMHACQAACAAKIIHILKCTSTHVRPNLAKSVSGIVSRQFPNHDRATCNPAYSMVPRMLLATKKPM
jgi:hypothetical protein